MSTEKIRVSDLTFLITPAPPCHFLSHSSKLILLHNINAALPDSVKKKALITEKINFQEEEIQLLKKSTYKKPKNHFFNFRLVHCYRDPPFRYHLSVFIK